MGTVEFAEHLGKEILEIEIVVDVIQECLIVVVIILPVGAMQVLNIELLLDLLPYMLEHIPPLFCRSVLEITGETDGLRIAARQRNLGYAAA